ncbi:MAG: biopolymer transporter ExbD [Prevotellaceae bacterium]|nr:biopolymer transporter ExbD [Prevotella sp.]MDD7258367.1 biopolymer transporter ExbD [Prevotellaceae bacterium]
MILFRHRKRQIPELNATSTADISFMLLIFFLVTTSMDADKGLERELPPMDSKKEETVADVNKSNVLKLRLTADNLLLVDDSVADLKCLKQTAMAFVAHCPDRKRHIITVDVDRKANYDTYYYMQNELMAAYRALRENRANRLYRQSFEQCSNEQQQALKAYYPQRIAEAYRQEREEP